MSLTLKGSVLIAFLGAAQAAEDVASADATPHSDGAEAAGEAEVHESEHELHAANAILFLFVALTVGIILRRAVTGFIIPYTGLLVIAGVTVGLIDQKADWEHMGQGIEIWLNMPPELFLLVFLPILLYGSGSSLDWHTFFRNSTQIFTLAFPGVAIHTCLVAVIYRYVFPYDWSWKESFLFGSIISATDPVAVVAIMKEVGASKRLGHLIEGESLINDGSAYVFFLIFFEMVVGDGRSGGATVGYFCRLVVLAALIGVAFGVATTLFLLLVYRDTVVEVTATIAAAFLCFWVAEDIAGVSGVLAVVTLAIFMAAIGKYAISPDVGHAMHIFWEVAEFIANTLVFFYFGIIIAERIWVGHNGADDDNVTVVLVEEDAAATAPVDTSSGDAVLRGQDWGWAVLNWIVLNVIRFVTISILKPFMGQFADGFSWKDVIMATWAGLRGAVGLSLALIVYLEEREARNSPGGSEIDPTFALIAVFFVGTMSIFTILVQGSTMPALLAFLGITRKTPVQMQHLLMAAKEVEEYANRNLSHLKDDANLGEPDWDEVISSTALDIGQLLPSKKELRDALERMGCNFGECEDSWDETMREVDMHVRGGGGGLRRRRSVFATAGMPKGGDKGSDNGDADGGGAGGAGAGENGAARGQSGAMMRHSLSFNVLNRARSANDEDERAMADALEDKCDDVGPGGTPSRHVHRDGGRDMADRMTAAHADAAHKVAGPKAQMRAVQTVDRLLRAYQDHKDNGVSQAVVLQDLRSRYLHAVSAVFAEGFEKGYLSGEQQAALHAIVAKELDDTSQPISDARDLAKLARPPIYIRAIVKLLSVLGSVLPLLKHAADKVLFLNMESDIGSVAAFVFAHTEAIKGMRQMITIIDDAYEGAPEDDDALQQEIQDQKDVVQAVIDEGSKSRDGAAAVLAAFKRDYPTLVRAVKTRETAQTVLMHKLRFIKSMSKAGLLEEKEKNLMLDLCYQRLKALYFRSPTIDLPSTWEVVKGHYLFDHFDEADLRHVLESGEAVTFNPNADLFRHGQPASRVFIILRGTAGRHAKDGTLVHVNGSGAAVGLSEAICGIPRLGTVTADTHVEAFTLGTKVFRAIMDRSDEFRLRAYQVAGAAISTHMQWSFMQGMSYVELVQAFKSAELHPELAAGETLTLGVPALLVKGAVTAFVPDRKLPNLARVGSTRQLLHRTSVHPPRAAKGEGAAPEVRGGRDVEITAPTMLEAGSYPVLEDAEVLSIPTKTKLHEVTRHMDHVRKLTLFRQSHDTSTGAVLNLVRPSAAFRNVAGMTIDRGDHGGGDDSSPTAGGFGSGTAERLRRGGGGRASMGYMRQMSSPAATGGQAGLARASSPMLSPFLSRDRIQPRPEPRPPRLQHAVTLPSTPSAYPRLPVSPRLFTQMSLGSSFAAAAAHQATPAFPETLSAPPSSELPLLGNPYPPSHTVPYEPSEEAPSSPLRERTFSAPSS
eukprot:jgi/Ulvmu1/2528/UM138_0033.1